MVLNESGAVNMVVRGGVKWIRGGEYGGAWWC